MEALMGIAANHNGYITSAQVTAATPPQTQAYRSRARRARPGGPWSLCASQRVGGPLLHRSAPLLPRNLLGRHGALSPRHDKSRALLPDDDLPQKLQRDYDQSSRLACRTCADDVPSLDLCDIVRGHGTPEIQLTTLAMKSCAQSEGYNPMKLVAYTRNLGVETKTRDYLEVLP